MMPCPASFQPNDPATLLRTGCHHAQQDQLLAAARHYLAVTQQQPDCFEAYCQLGETLNQLGLRNEALVSLQKAVQLRPTFPKLHLLLGSIYRQQQQFEAAAACCREETRLHPTNADAHYNLGLVLEDLDQPVDAAAAYEQALALRPGYVDALVNLGALRQAEQDFPTALRFFEEALRQEPENPEPHWHLGTALLAQGDFTRGWREYEWRWRLKRFTTPRPQFAQPFWNGAPLSGKRILLHCEQGFGDTIQFARYAALVADRGGEVILGCPAPLQSLLVTVPGVKEVTTHRATPPPFAVHTSLMSLPAIFQTTLSNVPAAIPYLKVPGLDQATAGPATDLLRVGLAWAGNPEHRNDRTRSLAFENLRPIVELPGVQCYSLQVGPRAGDLSRTSWGAEIEDWGSRFHDFSDTARAIAQLDLVIAVDTAVAHLAGALGRPVWTLLPYAAEWRWMCKRSDSPWYPTMRLFRQTKPGDWAALIQRVCRELASAREPGGAEQATSLSHASG